jgi:hypothetical protein
MYVSVTQNTAKNYVQNVTNNGRTLLNGKHAKSCIVVTYLHLK